MTRWRLLETWDWSPGANMALDEAQLELPGLPPTLRFYTWKPAALSLGWFQRVADVPAARDAAASGLIVVRRLTGGGAIHHAHELTYSLAAPETQSPFEGPVARSYERLHGVLAEVLADFGIATALRRATELRSDIAGTGMCFHASSSLDLVLDARKLVGSAQRRKRGRVLHHGSIKLGTTALESGVATLPGIAADALAAQCTAAFARAFDLDLERAEPSAAELAFVRAREAWYASAEHVGRSGRKQAQG
jgi:lipoate-protein ligase A